MNTCNTVSGSNLIVKVKEEANFGKSETTGFNTIYVKSNTVKFTQNAVESELLAAGRSPTKAGKGNIEVGGSLEIAIDNIQTGFWVKQLLGNYTVAAEGAKYKHTFKITDNCVPSFQLEKTLNGSDINYKAVGLKANSLKIDFGGEGEIIGTVDVLGKNEFFNTLQVDSTNYALTANANINTKTLLVSSTAGLEVGDVITLKVAVAALATAVAAGLSVIEVGTGEGASIVSGDFISLGGIVYQVKAISGDKVYISRPLEVALTLGTVVYNVGETNKIDSLVADTSITLLNGIKQALLFATDTFQGQSALTVLNDKSFEHFEIALTSTTGESITASVETCSFTFNNNAEGKRLISDKGTLGKILEGKTSITCELNIVFDADNARFLEEAKLGKEFDITLEAINTAGDIFRIIFPQGTLTPTTPEISSPTAISATVSYSPFKGVSTEAIVIELINDKTTY
jgi:hypothetical protein